MRTAGNNVLHLRRPIKLELKAPTGLPPTQVVPFEASTIYRINERQVGPTSPRAPQGRSLAGSSHETVVEAHPRELTTVAFDFESASRAIRKDLSDGDGRRVDANRHHERWYQMSGDIFDGRRHLCRQGSIYARTSR